jgi:hypothetical protein
MRPIYKFLSNFQLSLRLMKIAHISLEYSQNTRNIKNFYFLPVESIIILIFCEQVGLWSATWCGHKSTYFDETPMFFEWLDPESWNTITISVILYKIYADYSNTNYLWWFEI